MNLKGQSNVFDQSQKTKSNSNVKSLILFGIVGVFCLILVLLYFLSVNKQTPVTAVIDNVQNNKILTLKYDDPETKETYYPIKATAELLGYLAFDGSSELKSEDNTKCYVKCDDEIVDLTYNSKRVYKHATNSSDGTYEYVDLDNVVKSISGVLYMSQDGLLKVFNTSSYFNQLKNMYVYETLPYRYKTTNISLKEISSLGISKIDSKFVNKKALNDNYAIVESTTNKYGVISIMDSKNPEFLIEAKYDQIEYIPSLKAFMVSSDGKKGIINKDKSSVFDVVYDEINLIDPEVKLFCVKKNGKYGIMKDRYETKLSIEYDQIGIDTSSFLENSIKNKYFLANNLIPVKRDNKWGLLNKYGDRITDEIYDQLGCITNSDRYQKNLLYVQSYNLIVAKRDNKYTLINSSGQEIIKNVLDLCYIYEKDGVAEYRMSIGDKEYSIEDYVKGSKSLKETSDTSEIIEELSNDSEDEEEQYEQDDEQEYEDNEDYEEE